MAELSDNDLCHLYKWLHGNTSTYSCYASAEADELIIDVCDLIASRASWLEIYSRIGGSRIGDNDGTVHIVLSVVDHAGLISHGTILRYSWITERGEWVRRAYRKLGSHDLNMYGFPHMGEPCPTDCELGKLHIT